MTGLQIDELKAVAIHGGKYLVVRADEEKDLEDIETMGYIYDSERQSLSPEEPVQVIMKWVVPWHELPEDFGPLPNYPEAGIEPATIKMPERKKPPTYEVPDGFDF